MTITYDLPNFNARYYKDRAPVRRCARPWAMLHPQQPTRAVLLVHGYGGYPGELIRPGVDLFDAGFDVYCPRLPGHGTSGRDFSRSRAEDWIGVTTASFEYLKGRYGEVAIVGHSMGAALATITAAAFSVKKLVLLAPALLIPSIPVKQIRIMRHFIKRRRVEWVQDSEYHFYYDGDSDDDAYLGREYWSYVFLEQLWQLEQVRRKAVGVVETLASDTLAVIGGKDTVIAPQAALLVTSKPLGTNRHLELPSGGHFLPYDKDKGAQDEAMEATVAWLVTP
ncbi:MAG: alpha/beta fold hydrolase [Sphaerochaeta sp.]|jgi:carboxylesterase|nr:alpha/beta fold hydrolase [Sphaerochaeta sp.]